jgi:hypothetical protein
LIDTVDFLKEIQIITKNGCIPTLTAAALALPKGAGWAPMPGAIL